MLSFFRGFVDEETINLLASATFFEGREKGKKFMSPRTFGCFCEVLLDKGGRTSPMSGGSLYASSLVSFLWGLVFVGVLVILAFRRIVWNMRVSRIARAS